MKKIKFSPLFAVLPILLFCIFGKEAVIYIICILIHESGHCIAIAAAGLEIRRIKFTLCGLEIEPCGTQSYFSQIAVSAAGPLASFALCIFPVFRKVSLLLGLINLLPLSTLDGYGILFPVLCLKKDLLFAEKFIKISDAVILVLLGTVSLYSLIITRYNISLLIFTSYIFFTVFAKNY